MVAGAAGFASTGRILKGKRDPGPPAGVPFFYRLQGARGLAEIVGKAAPVCWLFFSGSFPDRRLIRRPLGGFWSVPLANLEAPAPHRSPCYDYVKRIGGGVPLAPWARFSGLAHPIRRASTLLLLAALVAGSAPGIGTQRSHKHLGAGSAYPGLAIAALSLPRRSSGNDGL